MEWLPFRARKHPMTVIPTLPPDFITRNAAEDILRRWQASAQARWKHIGRSPAHARLRGLAGDAKAYCAF